MQSVYPTSTRANRLSVVLRARFRSRDRIPEPRRCQRTETGMDRRDNTGIDDADDQQHRASCRDTDDAQTNGREPLRPEQQSALDVTPTHEPSSAVHYPRSAASLDGD